MTFSNAVFNIGATNGTVQVTYDGGDDGGTIKNCAHLTGTGIDLEACDEQVIAAKVFQWQVGDMFTYPQEAWGDTPNGTNAASVMIGNFGSVYPSAIEIGIPGAGGESIRVTNPASMLSYLPTSGVNGPLLFDETDPDFTTAGAFAGDLMALRLNVDFADADLIAGTLPTRFGDLTLCNYDPVPGLNGSSVRDILELANTMLGNGTVAYTRSQIAALVNRLTNAFAGGVPGTFAQDHLVIGPCPNVWHDGDVVTYRQADWGTDIASDNVASTLLVDNFASLYSVDPLRVGTGFSLFFTSSSAVRPYLPANGAAAPLSASGLDPTHSSSGQFGGEVLGLRLNIDFADAALTGASHPTTFGDLHLCNFTTPAAVNGMTVREFLATANTLLGGGSASITIAEAMSILPELNGSFLAGSPSTFAQDHLVAGPCPCVWQSGNMETLRQGDWDSTSMLSTVQPFSTVFASGLFVGTVGVPSRYSILLNSGPAVQGYLATAGSNTALSGDHVNPTFPYGGQFGAEVVALSLNVGFSAGGQLSGTFDLGDLYLCGITSPAVVNGKTVNEFLAMANLLLGGTTVSGITLDEATQIAAEINAAFVGGSPSAFACEHLQVDPCP